MRTSTVTVDRMLGRAIAACHRDAPGVLLSDENLKEIQEHADPKEIARGILELGPPFSPEELSFIQKYCDEPFSHDTSKMHMWKDDILQKYVDHIQNYYYKYKEEAQDIDPSIDPEEQHIGPMAQDIEKVNPAAVKETPEGVKTVDTGRLALMNAGAIAALAKEVGELKEEKGVPSDVGIKTDYTATFKPQYKKPEKKRRTALGYVLGDVK